MRIEFEVEDEEGAWIKQTAKQRGITVTQFIRDLCLSERITSELSPGPGKKNPSLQERFLADIRENFSIVRAAHRLKIAITKVMEWQQKDPEFVAELKAAQAYWVDGIQEEMVLVGQGKKKGNAEALGWLLNAHHPAYGRAKIELLLGMWESLVKKLQKFLREELGEAAEEGIKKAFARFEIERRKKFVKVT